MRITQKEIARRAGVSQVTVSQVLNRSRNMRISPDKRREITMLAQSLNYQPRNVTTHTIGYVMRVTDNEGEIQTLKETKAILAAEGYRLLLIDIDDLYSAHLRQALNAKTVDGIVFTNWPTNKIRDWLSPEVPYVVAADVDDIGPDIDQVMIDSFQTSRTITEYLIGKCHRRICFATGLTDSSLHRSQKQGVYAAFENAGIPTSQISLIETSYAHEMEPLLQKAMKQSLPPTAFLGLTFNRVAKTVNFLQANGYRIPQDVSVASVFDSANFAWLQPAITSMSASGHEIAGHAARRILEKIQDPDTSPEKLVIPSHLIERSSVVAPKT